MINIDFQQISAALLQIVADMRYNPGLSFNTYGEVDDRPDLAAPTFGFSYDDYKESRFWSRTWVNQGASPETVSAEFPVLFSELQDLEPRDKELGQRLNILRFSLVAVDKIVCNACPDYIPRTGPAVQWNVVQMLHAVVHELSTSGVYMADDAGEISYLFVSKGRADYLATANPGISYVLIEEFEPAVVKVGPIRRWGNYPDLRGATMDVYVEFCFPWVDRFEYNSDTVPALSTTKCPCL